MSIKVEPIINFIVLFFSALTIYYIVFVYKDTHFIIANSNQTTLIRTDFHLITSNPANDSPEVFTKESVTCLAPSSITYGTSSTAQLAKSILSKTDKIIHGYFSQKRSKNGTLEDAKENFFQRVIDKQLCINLVNDKLK